MCGWPGGWARADSDAEGPDHAATAGLMPVCRRLAVISGEAGLPTSAGSVAGSRLEGGRLVRRGRCTPLLSRAEQRDRLLDAPLPRLGGFCPVDVVEVVPLEAVGELGEEGLRVRVGGKGSGEVAGNVEFARGVGQRQRHVDRVAALEAGLLPDGSADADHVLAAHHADRGAVQVAVHVDDDRRSPACTELLDEVVGYDDPGVIAGRGHRGIESDAGCHLSLLSRIN